MAWKIIERSRANTFAVFIFEGRMIGGFFLFTLSFKLSARSM